MYLVCSMFFKPSSLIFPSIQQERRNKPHFLCTDRRNKRRDGSHQMDFERATNHLLHVVLTLQYDICIVMLCQYVRRSVFLEASCLARQFATHRLTSFKGTFVSTRVNSSQFFGISRAIRESLSTEKVE